MRPSALGKTHRQGERQETGLVRPEVTLRIRHLFILIRQ